MAPVVDLSAPTSAPPAKTAPKPAGPASDELMLGGGALALLALGGAYALSRRRRQKEEYVEEWVDQPAMTEAEPMAPAPEPSHDPIFDQEQPAIVAPSAFTWGATAPATQRGGRDGDDDRLPGETWVERAYRGPSPGNPSVSLKARLRRAAFFDKRERDVAAGIAQPVDADAGLPAQQRELA